MPYGKVTKTGSGIDHTVMKERQIRRLLVLLPLAMLVSLALGASVVNATHSKGNGPQQDLVSGTGQMDVLRAGQVLENKIHVNAKSDPSGEDPRGRFHIEGDYYDSDSGLVTPVDIRGEVTCLKIEGNKATVRGEIVRGSNNPLPEGSRVWIFIVDDEEGVEDRVSWTWTFSEDCPAPFPPFLEPYLPINQGNFIVHDATPYERLGG